MGRAWGREELDGEPTSGIGADWRRPPRGRVAAMVAGGADKNKKIQIRRIRREKEDVQLSGSH